MKMMLLMLLLLAACAPIVEPQGTVVTVRFATPEQISDTARDRGLRGQANGFYDANRNEIWCPWPVHPETRHPDEDTKRAYQICGHELYHAVQGRFHP